MSTPRELFEKRKARVRTALKNAANGKMRLSVFRSGKHIYAQIIDDAKGSTVVSASTLDKEVRDQIKKSSTVEAASFIGKVVALRSCSRWRSSSLLQYHILPVLWEWESVTVRFFPRSVWQ